MITILYRKWRKGFIKNENILKHDWIKKHLTFQDALYYSFISTFPLVRQLFRYKIKEVDRTEECYSQQLINRWWNNSEPIEKLSVMIWVIFQFLWFFKTPAYNGWNNLKQTKCFSLQTYERLSHEISLNFGYFHSANWQKLTIEQIKIWITTTRLRILSLCKHPVGTTTLQKWLITLLLSFQTHNET